MSMNAARDLPKGYQVSLEREAGVKVSGLLADSERVGAPLGSCAMDGVGSLGIYRCSALPVNAGRGLVPVDVGENCARRIVVKSVVGILVKLNLAGIDFRVGLVD